MRGPRQLVTLVALSLTVVACGGSPQPSGEDPLTATEFGRMLTDSLDDDGVAAGAALVLALDRGYSFGQLVDATATGSLRRHGVVVSGQTLVDPDGPDAGLIIDKGPAQLEAAGAILVAADLALGNGLTVSELEGHLDAFMGFAGTVIANQASQDAVEAETDDLFFVVPAAIAHLADAGYSAQQIVESVVFGTLDCIYAFSSFPDRPGYAVHVTACEISGEAPALSAPDLLGDEPGETTTTAPQASGDGFVGELHLMPGLEEYFTLDSSRIEITMDGSSAIVVMETTLTYVARYINETPDCTVTARTDYQGLLAIDDGAFSGSLTVGSGEIVAAVGAGCGVTGNWQTTVSEDYAMELAENPSLPIEGAIDGGTTSGTVGEGMFSFTARG